MNAFEIHDTPADLIKLETKEILPTIVAEIYKTEELPEDRRNAL